MKTHFNFLNKKLFLLLGAAIVVFLFIYFDVHKMLTFEALKTSKDKFQSIYDKNPLLTIGAYLLLYVTTTALSLPGATVLTLAGGALFGFVTGLVLVSFASTVGATLAFLGCRFLLKDWVREKFGDKLKTVYDGVEKEGGFYLLTLRLVPIFPFFMINLAMGLTPISTLKFFIISQLGMLPGTIVYVNAGTQLGQLESLSGIISPALLGSFALLGVFPIAAKKILERIKK